MGIKPLDLSVGSLYPPDFSNVNSQAMLTAPPTPQKTSSTDKHPHQPDHRPGADKASSSSSSAPSSLSSGTSPASFAASASWVPVKTEKNRLHALPPGYWAPLLDSLQSQALHQRALRQMQQLCRDAQTLQRGGAGLNRFSWQAIPLWGWLLLLALGWNELTAVLGWICSSWLTLPLVLLCVFAGGAAVCTGNVEVALTSLQHFVLVIRTIAVPLTRQVLLKALNLVEVNRQDSGVAAQGRGRERKKKKKEVVEGVVVVIERRRLCVYCWWDRTVWC